MGKEALNLQRATESCEHFADPAQLPAGIYLRGIQGSVEHKRLWFSLGPLKAAAEAGLTPRLNLSQTILSADSAIALHDIARGECFLSKPLSGFIKVIARRADKEQVSAIF